MSDFIRYMERQAETRAARARHDAADARLQIALIMERLAELKSQHSPLADIIVESGLSCNDPKKSPREALYAAAFYAVIGRTP